MDNFIDILRHIRDVIWVDIQAKYTQIMNSTDAAAGSAATASTKAGEAVVSASAAAGSAATASTKAGEAVVSASAAAGSAATASTKAGEAVVSETKASKWADEAEDVEVETGKYSARHWALKALGLVTDGVIDDTTVSAIKVWSSDKVNDELLLKANISDVADQISALVNSSPAALDTLNELAAALGNDANFATTITTALSGKQATITGAATTITTSNLSASKAMVTDGSGKVSAHSTVSDVELGYLDGVTSAIQTQINTKAPLASPAFTGTPTAPTPSVGDNDISIATTAFVNAEISNDVGVANSALVKTALNAGGTAPIYACRAWVYFNAVGTVTILGSGNVSSITDNAVGNFTENFITAMPDASYCPVDGMGRTDTQQTAMQVNTMSTTGFSFQVRLGNNNANVDNPMNFISVFR